MWYAVITMIINVWYDLSQMILELLQSFSKIFELEVHFNFGFRSDRTSSEFDEYSWSIFKLNVDPNDLCNFYSHLEVVLAVSFLVELSQSEQVVIVNSCWIVGIRYISIDCVMEDFEVDHFRIVVTCSKFKMLVIDDTICAYISDNVCYSWPSLVNSVARIEFSGKPNPNDVFSFVDGVEVDETCEVFASCSLEGEVSPLTLDGAVKRKLLRKYGTSELSYQFVLILRMNCVRDFGVVTTLEYYLTWRICHIILVRDLMTTCVLILCVLLAQICFTIIRLLTGQRLIQLKVDSTFLFNAKLFSIDVTKLREILLLKKISIECMLKVNLKRMSFMMTLKGIQLAKGKDIHRSILQPSDAKNVVQTS